VYDDVGSLICQGGFGQPGYPLNFVAIEVEQAGTAVKVTGPGPYTIR
jgi:hypothetical protein